MLRSCISLNSRSIRATVVTLAMCAIVTLRFMTPAHADADTYGSQQRVVNAAVLLLDGMNDGQMPIPHDRNYAPYIFYVLDQRNDLKPYGWSFVNPGAPGTITADILNRWDALAALDGYGSSGYTLGQQILPNMAPYWEVNLKTLDSTNIGQYDVLFLEISGTNVRFTRHDAEVLRRFVDGGGVLWIETDSGGGVYQVNNTKNYYDLFFGALCGPSSASGAVVPLYGSIPYRHPVISSPYLLSLNELNQLPGVKNGATVVDDSLLLAPVIKNGVATADLAGTFPATILAGQYGAGEVVVSAAQDALAVNDSVRSPFPGATHNDRSYSGGDFSSISSFSTGLSASCKLAYNIIAWSGTHPQEHQNSHQTNSTQNALSAAVVSTWNYTPPPPIVVSQVPNQVPGAAIFGKITVVRDSSGILHAFDTVPSDHLYGNASPDDGNSDYSKGFDYDELWSVSVGVDASAPTIATLPDGTTVAMVQMGNGAINYYNLASTGTPTAVTLTPPVGSLSAGTVAYDGTTALGPATAPTYYAGRVFAALHLTGANGLPALYMHDFYTNSNNVVFVNPKHTTSSPAVTADEWPTGSPSIGVLAWEQTSLLVNDITLFVPTTSGVYSLLLGIRGDTLTSNPPDYITRLTSMTPLGTILDDTTGIGPTSSLGVFDLTSGYPDYTTYGVNAAKTGFTATSMGGATAPPYFANYDTVFTNSTTPPLTRLLVSTVSKGSGRYTSASTVISAPAMDNVENIYYTVNDGLANGGMNSTLVCVHDSKEPTSRKMRWRFRLPHSSDGIVDADGVSYNKLEGSQFVGSPVVDDRGLVFVAAKITTGPNVPGFAILCFDTNRNIYANLFDNNGTATGNTTIASVTQPYGGGTEFSASEDPNANPINATQFSANNSTIDITNFAFTTVAPLTVLDPNLNEPNPITVKYNVTVNGQTATDTATTIRPLHTNLVWYSIVPTTANITGLTKVGNYLYLGSSAATGTFGAPLYHAYAYPDSGLISGTDRSVLPNKIGLDAPQSIRNLNSIDAVPSADNGVMILNGTSLDQTSFQPISGISAVSSQTTLVADNNRLIELDANGDAVWSLDSTSVSTPATATTPSVTTELELNRPTSISQIASNDYLIVDSGNNRVVQVDHAGKAVWELNKFVDTHVPALMAPGEPDHLNHPTSAQTWSEYIPASGGSLAHTDVHYLITDTGNFRVLEILDKFNDNGIQVNDAGTPTSEHRLNWISHTSDILGRQYQYVGATYFTDSLGHQKIVALVNNRRIAAHSGSVPTVLGTMSPASADTPGSSIVQLDYDPNGLQPSLQKDGYISYTGAGNLLVITGFQTYINPATGKYDLTASNLVTLPLRNPRFLSSYATWEKVLGVDTTVQHFLLADDNGVFDLKSPDGISFTSYWGYTPKNYQGMGTPIVGNTITFVRSTIAFTPTCVQKTATSQYLITNSATKADSADPSSFGGEAFEVDAATNDNILDIMGLYTGHTYSRPTNAGAIAQPTYAIRPQ